MIRLAQWQTGGLLIATLRMKMTGRRHSSLFLSDPKILCQTSIVSGRIEEVAPKDTKEDEESLVAI